MLFIVLYWNLTKPAAAKTYSKYILANQRHQLVYGRFIGHGNAGKCDYVYHHLVRDITTEWALLGFVWIAVGNGSNLHGFYSGFSSPESLHSFYEVLEERFDLKLEHWLRLFSLFTSIGTGITIYAPAIILSSILNWDLTFIIVSIGIVIIFYTYFGGTKALNITQNSRHL